MATPAATGATTYLRAKFETTYGVQATGNFQNLPAYEVNGLNNQRNLLTEPVMGLGREPTAPVDGAINVTPSVVVPVDERNLGYWLKLVFGTAQSDTQIGARGYIAFTANPSNGATIGLNGVTWTFVTSGATGPQTNIAGSLEATLDDLVSDLNGSADTDIDDATYSRLGDRLVIQHDTADTSGNTFALASSASTARVSGSTLSGGGYYKHIWHSGSLALPSMTVESDRANVTGSARFSQADGVLANSISFERQREAIPKATVDLRGRAAPFASSTIGGTPTSSTLTPFGAFQGQLLLDDRPVANLTSANITYANNLLANDDLTDDGYQSGFQPGVITANASLGGRWSNNEVFQAVYAGSTIDLRFGFYNATTGGELELRLHQLHLPLPSLSISGTDFANVTFESIAAKEASAGRSATCTLINDVASY